MELLSSLKNIDISELEISKLFKFPTISVPIFTSYMPFQMEGFFQTNMVKKGKNEKDASGNIVPSQSRTVMGTFLAALINSIYIFTYITIILFIGMLVSNDMINLPTPMRIFGFLVAVIISLTPPGMILFAVYYGLRVFYAISMNFIIDRKNPNKIPYYPKLFALLPIYNGRIENTFLGILMYPFTYPKSQVAHDKLQGLVEKYKVNLEDSFGSGFESYLKSIEGAKESYDNAMAALFGRHGLSPTIPNQRIS